MEDEIPRWLQHHHETCCEWDGCYGRWAWFGLAVDKECTMEMYCSGQVDLAYNTSSIYKLIVNFYIDYHISHITDCGTNI